MEAKDYRWIITVDEHGPKIEIIRPSDVVDAPHMVCPSVKMPKQEWDSGIYWSNEKGMRIALIRIIYSVCQMNLIYDKFGNKVADKQVFDAFGQFFHMDLSRYNNDLTRAMSDNTSLEKQTEIFQLMSNTFRNKYLD